MSFVDYLSSKIRATIEHSCFWGYYKDIDGHIRFYIQDTAIAQRRFLQTVFNQPNHEAPFMANLKQHVENIDDSYVYGRIGWMRLILIRFSMVAALVHLGR